MTEVTYLSPAEVRDRADRLWDFLLRLMSMGVVKERDLAQFYFSGWCSNQAAGNILDELGSLDFLAGGLW